MESPYDRVNIKKVFEVMRRYGVQFFVDVIEKNYDGSMHWRIQGLGVGGGCKF